MGAFIKSFIFNIAFYVYTAFCCFALVFAFALPRKAAFVFVQTLYFKGIVWVERIFLGLNYRVTGREHLPTDKSYILAVKHYSTYETLKMPVIFGDIAIILKKELTWIPFWGWYTLKTGMIPVDRGAKGKALASLLEGGKRVIAQKRPILIFPQGTRVDADDTTAEKPYKIGIAKIAEALNLPVVPVALNSAAFWPKKAFVKKSGVVDFKILPMIPAGLPAAELLKRLEDTIEPESRRLMANAQIKKRGGAGWVVFALFLLGLWAAWWHTAAYAVKQQLARMPQTISSPNAPVIDGFPMQLHVKMTEVAYKTPSGSVFVPLAEAKIWPVPGGAGQIGTPIGFTADAVRNEREISFTADDYRLDFRLPVLWKPRAQWALQLRGVTLTSGNIAIRGEGAIDVPMSQAPINGTLSMAVAGYKDAIEMLINNELVEADQARMASAFFDAMAVAQGGGDALRFPLNVKDDVVYAGFLRLLDLKDLRSPTGQSAAPLQRIRSGDWGTNVPPAPALQIPLPEAQP